MSNNPIVQSSFVSSNEEEIDFFDTTAKRLSVPVYASLFLSAYIILLFNTSCYYYYYFVYIIIIIILYILLLLQYSARIYLYNDIHLGSDRVT